MRNEDGLPDQKRTEVEGATNSSLLIDRIMMVVRDVVRLLLRDVRWVGVLRVDISIV